MRLKTIWMQLLLIGILSSLASCYTQVDGFGLEEYLYINKTGDDITIEAFVLVDSTIYKDIYSLKNDSVLLQTAGRFLGRSRGYVVSVDSLSIIFGANKSVPFLRADTLSPYNVLNRKNYEIVIVSEKFWKYTYTFTVADVNNALSK